jgi:surface protein
MGKIYIYINNKKIKFDYKYKSSEKGNIKVIFKFNKLLTSTNNMFSRCSSLESIDLSSFNTSNVNNMSCVFDGCSSLIKENIKINESNKRILDELN